MKILHPRARALGAALLFSFFVGSLLSAAPRPASRAADAGAKASKQSAGYKKPKPTEFLRVRRDKEGTPVSLQTAVVSYVPVENESALQVDLVGAVHVGDKGYYERLNKLFQEYDVLLYELVAPKGARVPRDRRGGLVPALAKNLLELDSQVECIDYTKKNFVHADMSPDEMAAAMRKRGDDTLTVMLKVFTEMMQQQNLQMQKAKADGQKRKLPDIDLATILFDPRGSLKIKRFMADQLEQTDEAGLGATLNTMLIADRNKAAVKVLDEEIKKGRKKIGIFYGAAHMPDFEKRLLAEYGLKRKSVKWVTAWDLTK